MLIRLATLKDIPQVMSIIKTVVGPMYAAGNKQWDENYPNAAVFENDIGHGQLWVVEMEGHIAGVAAITTDQEPEYAQIDWDINETAIVTHRLAVDPQFRGKGVGAALLEQAEKLATERKINTLRIDTNTMNLSSQGLFLKTGYVFMGEIGLSFRPGLRFYCYEHRLDHKNKS